MTYWKRVLLRTPLRPAMPDISRRAWHSRSINISIALSAVRFDCGSGVGTVRSTETVKLNEWNTLSVYRHRWDAWIQLNQEKRVEGRSKVRALHFISIKARRRILFTRIYPRVFNEEIDISRRGGTYYRDYQWVYSNSRDSYGRRPPAPPWGLSARVLCNGAIRNWNQLIAIMVIRLSLTAVNKHFISFEQGFVLNVALLLKSFYLINIFFKK